MLVLRSKSISALISIILLIVVSILIIGIIINWSKRFILTNTDKADIVQADSSLDQFIVIDSFFDSSNQSSIILKNNSSKDVVLENYQFINSGGVFYNSDFLISNDRELKKGNFLKVNLVCFPSKYLDVLFKTIEGDYF